MLLLILLFMAILAVSDRLIGLGPKGDLPKVLSSKQNLHIIENIRIRIKSVSSAIGTK
jgi:hypothetical protein